MASTAAALLPKISLQDDQIVLSHLRIGHTRAPRVPRGIFHTVIIEAGVSKPEADEAFDHILHVNRMRFLELLASTEMHEGPMIVTLRKMAQFQLEAISHCIGTRHFDEPADVQAAAWQASIRH